MKIQLKNINQIFPKSKPITKMRKEDLISFYQENEYLMDKKEKEVFNKRFFGNDFINGEFLVCRKQGHLEFIDLS